MSTININVEELSEEQAKTLRLRIISSLTMHEDKLFPDSSWRHEVGYPDDDTNTLMNERGLLSYLIEALNDLDGDDCFGTEGWQHYLGFE